MVLEDREHDQLVDAFRDEGAQVRATGPVVLEVGADVDEVHLDVFVAVVASDRILAEAGEVLDKLRAVVLGGQATPANASGDRLVHPGAHEFRAVAVVDEHVARLDAGRLQALDHFEHQFGRGVGERVAVGDDLDADDVAGFEEGPPGFGGVVGTDEFLHASRQRLLDGFAILLAVANHARVARFDHPTRERTRCPQVGCELDISRCARHGRRDPQGLTEDGSRNGRGQQGSPGQLSARIAFGHGG